VVHALELAVEDVRRWCGDLRDAEWNARPWGLPSPGFQLRHMARSLDRLLTYAEAGALSEEQVEALGREGTEAGTGVASLAEFEDAVARAVVRVKTLCVLNLGSARFVGKRRLTSSLGGILVHVAEHTKRHVGQAVTTAKVLLALRGLGA
jgi:uncharacterized damage-inducible protein DinB